MKIEIDTNNLDEGVLHSFVKQYLWYKIKNLSPEARILKESTYQYYESTLHNKHIPYGGMFNVIHKENFTNNIYLEFASTFNGKIYKPDITMFSDKQCKNPETVIEIVDTNPPNINKIYDYIDSNINVVVIDVRQISLDNFGPDPDYPFRIPFVSYRKDEIKSNKIARSLKMIIKCKWITDRWKKFDPISGGFFVSWNTKRGYYLRYRENSGNPFEDHPSTQHSTYDGHLNKNASKKVISLCQHYAEIMSKESSLDKEFFWEEKSKDKEDYKHCVKVKIIREYNNYDKPFFLCELIDKNSKNDFLEVNAGQTFGLIGLEDQKRMYQENDVKIFEINSINYGNEDRIKYYIQKNARESDLSENQVSIKNKYWKLVE